MTVGALLAETASIILVIAYIIFQIMYLYKYPMMTISGMIHIAVIILIYLFFTVLSVYPEWIHRLQANQCKGSIRKYSLRMVRSLKLLLIVGLLIPSIYDVMGKEMRPVYSLILIGILVILVVYYEYQIIRILRNNRK